MDRDLGVEGLEDAAWIGSGASATVYRARQTKLDRQVAVKVLTQRDGSFVRRFEREARILGQLSQKPGIVTVYDTGVTEDGQPYLILELCPSSLEDRITAQGPLPPSEACRVLAEVAEAVAAAHDAGVVHRDIKPGNILISPDGRPLVTDFGIGAMIDPSGGTSTSIGFTPGYVAPETLGGARATEPADVYAVGATLHHLLTGRAPFVDTLDDPANLLALVSKVVNEPVPDLRGRGVPEAVCRVLELAMAKDPSQRPTAAGLAVALTDAADGRSPASWPPAAPVTDTVAADAASSSPGSDPLGGPQPTGSRPRSELDVSSPPGTGSARATTDAPPPPSPAPPPGSIPHPEPAPDPRFRPPPRPASPDPWAGSVAGGSRSPATTPDPAHPVGGMQSAAPAGSKPGGGRRSAVVALLVVGGLLALLIVLAAAALLTVRSTADGESEGGNEPVISTDGRIEGSAEEPVDRPTSGSGSGSGDAERDFVTTLPPDPSNVVEAAPICNAPSDGVLRLGGLLPLTGELRFLGRPMEAAARLAVDDINAAGGVNGQPVEWIARDSTNNSAAASVAVEELLDRDVDVVIGAATSALSRDVAQTVADRCVAQISPSNTASSFTTEDPAELYFRITPSDLLQAVALAQLVVIDDNESAYLLGLNLAYGQELVGALGPALETRGAAVVGSELYTADETDFGPAIEAVMAESPDALILVGFGETERLLTQLLDAGYGPSAVNIYLVDGNLRHYDRGITTPGALVGVKGTRPGAVVSEELRQRMLSIDPDLEEFIYGPEAYDAVLLAALAAATAESDSSSELAKRINGVTLVGEACRPAADCLDLIAQGVDIDYNGLSGPLSFTAPGEPAEAAYRVMVYGPDNRLEDAEDLVIMVAGGS